MSNLRLLIEKNVVLASTFIVMLGIVVTAFNVDVSAAEPSSESVEATWYVKSYTNVSGLEAPTLLENAIIWHPAGEDVLVYERLDGETDPIRYEWVVGIPQNWLTVPANGIGDQHLLWLNTDGRLWRSEINEDGEQILGVLAVGGFNVLDYGAISLTDELTLIWWQSINGISKSVYIVVIDQLGRPLEQRRLLQNADQFDLTLQLSSLYLTWTNETPSGYLLHYTELSVNELMRVEDLETSATGLPISTNIGDWIDSLDIQTDLQEINVIWSIMGIENPDYANFQGAVWKQSDPTADPAIFDLHIGDEATKLRWEGRLRVPQDLTRTQVVINALLDGQWRPVLAEIENGAVASYDVIWDEAANASAAHVWISEDNDVTATWGSLQEQGIVQYVVSNRPNLVGLQNQKNNGETEGASFGESLLKWFLSLPYGILWLLLPMTALVGLERNRTILPSVQIVLILVAYWLVKSLIHGDVLDTPPNFDYTDSDVVAVGVALGSSALVAGAIAQRIWSMDVNWRSVLTVFLVGDMLMTYLIFGANLG